MKDFAERGLDSYINEMKGQELSDNTIRKYVADIKQCDISLKAMSNEDVRAFKCQLGIMLEIEYYYARFKKSLSICMFNR